MGKKKTNRGSSGAGKGNTCSLVGEGIVPDKVEFGTEAWKVWNAIQGIVSEGKDPRLADRRRQVVESLKITGNKPIDADFITNCFTYAMERRASETSSNATGAKPPTASVSSWARHVPRPQRAGSDVSRNEVDTSSRQRGEEGCVAPRKCSHRSHRSSSPGIMAERSNLQVSVRSNRNPVRSVDLFMGQYRDGLRNHIKQIVSDGQNLEVITPGKVHGYVGVFKDGKHIVRLVELDLKPNDTPGPDILLGLDFEDPYHKHPIDEEEISLLSPDVKASLRSDSASSTSSNLNPSVSQVRSATSRQSVEQAALDALHVSRVALDILERNRE